MAGTALRSARQSSAARIAYSVTWASLRTTSSHVESSVEPLGSDENAKITAAQATTGTQVPSTERRTGTAGLDTAEW